MTDWLQALLLAMVPYCRRELLQMMVSCVGLLFALWLLWRRGITVFCFPGSRFVRA